MIKVNKIRLLVSTAFDVVLQKCLTLSNGSHLSLVGSVLLITNRAVVQTPGKISPFKKWNMNQWIYGENCTCYQKSAFRNRFHTIILPLMYKYINYYTKYKKCGKLGRNPDWSNWMTSYVWCQISLPGNF